MERGVVVCSAAAPESLGGVEPSRVFVESRDGAFAETTTILPADEAVGTKIPTASVVEEDSSPEKPPTPPTRLTLEQLRAEIDETVGSLPDVLRMCTVRSLAERVAPVFHEADHVRSPAVAPELLVRSRAHPTWEALEVALRKLRRPSIDGDHAAAHQNKNGRNSESLATLFRAADRLECFVLAADRPLPTDEDEAFGVATPLGVGLVACGGCGRVLARDALQRHARRNKCAEHVTGLLGASGSGASADDVIAQGKPVAVKGVHGGLRVDDAKRECTNNALSQAPAQKLKPKPSPTKRGDKKKEKEKETSAKAKAPTAATAPLAPTSTASPHVPKEKRSKKPRKARAELSLPGGFVSDDDDHREARRAKDLAFANWRGGLGLGTHQETPGNDPRFVASPRVAGDWAVVTRDLLGESHDTVPVPVVASQCTTPGTGHGQDLPQLLRAQRDRAPSAYHRGYFQNDSPQNSGAHLQNNNHAPQNYAGAMPQHVPQHAPHYGHFPLLNGDARFAAEQALGGAARPHGMSPHQGSAPSLRAHYPLGMSPNGMFPTPGPFPHLGMSPTMSHPNGMSPTALHPGQTFAHIFETDFDPHGFEIRKRRRGDDGGEIQILHAPPFQAHQVSAHQIPHATHIPHAHQVHLQMHPHAHPQMHRQMYPVTAHHVHAAHAMRGQTHSPGSQAATPTNKNA